MNITRLKNSLVKKTTKTVIPLLLGGLIVWMLYRNSNIEALWQIIQSANYRILAFSLIFGLAGNVFRALRWEMLINSLGYYPRSMSLIYAVQGNYAVNFVLPRAGELWRCGAVAKYDKMPFSKAFGTMLADRLMDVVAMFFIFPISLLLNLDFFERYFHQNPDYGKNITSLFSSAWLYVILFAFIFFVTLIFTIFRHARFVQRISNFFAGLKRDWQLIRAMKGKFKFILYTFLIWFAYYLYFYICFFAFDFTKELGAAAGLIVFVMSSFGVAAPVQGGIGAWHFMVISSLLIFGITWEQGSAFAGAVFAIQTVWVILCGIIGIIAMPYVKREKISLKNR